MIGERSSHSLERYTITKLRIIKLRKARNELDHKLQARSAQILFSRDNDNLQVPALDPAGTDFECDDRAK